MKENKYRTMNKKRIKRDLIQRTILGGVFSGLSLGITMGLGLRWPLRDRPDLVVLVLIMIATSFVLSVIKGWWITPSGTEILEALGLEVNNKNIAKYDYFIAYFLVGFVFSLIATGVSVYIIYPFLLKV